MATVKKSKKKVIVPICIVLVIAIIAGVIFGVTKASSGEEVSLYTIDKEDIYESVSLTGEVSSGTVKEYKVGTVATVKEVFVKVGDKVKKGDVLATFDVESFDNQITSLRSSYNESLSSYNSSLKAQQTAQSKADAIAADIDSTEKQIERLKNSPATTTAKKTTKATTTAVMDDDDYYIPDDSFDPDYSDIFDDPDETTKPVTKPTTSEVTEQPSLAESLAELNRNLSQITNDLNTLTAMTEIITETITDAIASGVFDSDIIADRVSVALSKALKDGIIDAANLLVESDIAVQMVHAAVSAIDFKAIANTVVNSNNVSLTAAQLQLASLEAQHAIYKAQADGTIVSAQKKAVDATKKALDVLEQQKKDMEQGWIAAFDGTITEVDITAGVQTTVLSTGIKLENLDSMAVTVSLSEYDLHKVKVGMPVKVTTAYGTYDGEVTAIAPTATGGSSGSILDSVGSMAGISGLSSLTGSGAGVECTVTIPETDENIIAGFDADVEIKTGEYLGVTAVPIESIKLEKTGSYVYLYNEEEKTVTKTQIETGAVSDAVYQVKSGIKEGDKIIAAPESTYEEDTFKVKVIEK